MPAPKGSYNARRYHEEAARAIEASLQRVLDSLSSGMVFTTVSALAAHVADACGQTAGNLRRNSRYRAMLEKHLARQPGAVGLIGDDTRSIAIMRAKLLQADLRAANLERDKKRLEAFIERHLSEAAATSSARSPLRKPRVEPVPDYRKAFECTAAALDAIIEHAEVLAVDPITKALVDRSARPGSPPVVGGHLMEDFVRWRHLRNAP